MPTRRNQHRSARLMVRKLLPTALAGWSLALLAGSLAGLAAIKGGLNELTSAQLSMGTAGLIAGWAYTRMARKAGAAPTEKHALLFATILAVSLVLGVTPLYAAVGSALKLAILSFYSFAFTGALAGLALFLVIKSISPDQPPGDPAVLFTIGYFSLGLAAGAASAVDLLAGYLPRTLVILLPMALIILMAGTGSAATMATSLTGQSRRKTNIPEPAGLDAGAQQSQRRFTSLALICIAVPFYLNDFANIFIPHWGHWLAIDYLFAKTYPLLGLAYLISTNRITWSQVGLTGQKPISFTVVFLMGTLSVLFILENDSLVSRFVSGYTALGWMPAITDPFWYQFDLYAGLMLVAIVEELIFRGLFCFVIEKYTRNPVFIVCFSAIAFGLIHWSAGFSDVAAAVLAGVVYMALYIRTRSLPAIILSHFVVDWVIFSRLIPPGLLAFM
jgi:membrane protease YdiL (CAAX protease family)